jgi:L-lysine exporter family protein LysE/ArgO
MSWLQYIFQGFIFGAVYVAPIGPQNLFVINTAINYKDIKYILKTAAVVVFFDISLALACFIGIGIVFEVLPVLKLIILFMGFLVITIMGIRLIVNKTEVEYDDHAEKLAFTKIVALSFSVAWLNPQALIDGTMLFGGMRASLPINYANIFIVGVCLASVFWFNILAILAYKIADKIKKMVKYINKICGIILVFYGLKLGYEFIKNVIIPHV